MWQRIQTLYLLLAIACLGTACFLPLWGGANGIVGVQEVWMVHKGDSFTAFIQQDYDLFAILIGLGGSVLLAVAALVSYTRRGVQFRLCVLLILCNGVLAAGAGYLAYTTGEALGGGYGLVGAWIAGILAARGIRKDIRLVRSADRFR